MKGKSLVFKRKLSATTHATKPHYRMVLPGEIVEYLNLTKGGNVLIEAPVGEDYIIIRRGD